MEVFVSLKRIVLSTFFWWSNFFAVKGLEDPVPAASELDEKNAMALAIVPAGKLPRKSNCTSTLECKEHWNVESMINYKFWFR